MLNAQAEAGGNQPEGEPMSAPIATNFSNATGTGDAKTAGVSGEMGPFFTNEPTAEKGAVNLHNNPDLPADRNDSPQGVLPDTDQTGMPINSGTNFPD